MITIKKSTSFTSRLRTLPLGQPVTIKNRDIKPSYVRSVVSLLRKEGLNFLCTETGLIDELRVTRIK
jgi:hypothetical protein